MTLYRSTEKVEAYRFGHEPQPLWWTALEMMDLAYIHHWGARDEGKAYAGIRMPDGITLIAQIGDWIIGYPSETIRVLKHPEFTKLYEEVPS